MVDDLTDTVAGARGGVDVVRLDGAPVRDVRALAGAGALGAAAVAGARALGAAAES